MKELTLKEAIEQGYTCALDDNGEYFILLSDVDEYSFEHHTLYLGDKTPFKFYIGSSAIQNLLENYVEDQDEVNDEDGKLYDKLANVDWEAVANLINPVFTTDYYSVTDIKLIP